MTTTVAHTSPLVPTLPDVADKRQRHEVTVLRGGDQLHFTAKALGFPKGAVLPIYGYCVLFDEAGKPFQVRAYVRPTGHNADSVAYAEREAVRFRCDNQREIWFGAVLMFLTEIDLTDLADCLKLERQPESVGRVLYPEIHVSHRQAA